MSRLIRIELAIGESSNNLANSKVAKGRIGLEEKKLKNLDIHNFTGLTCLRGATSVDLFEKWVSKFSSL